MRFALVALLALTGCPSDSTSWGGGGGGFGGGGGGGGGYYYPDGGVGIYGACQQDSDCAGNSGATDAGSGVDAGSGTASDAGASGLVCARDGVCVPANEVMTVHVKWELQNQPASTATCASSTDLELDFSSAQDGYGYGYAPVPCVEGEFTITKLENYYTNVSLETQGQPGTGSSGMIPSGGGTVTLDLPY
jgi:hypothetical protein